ncbi:hypothetical protein TWF281_004906 [Arthrobotrys megalospora]
MAPQYLPLEIQYQILESAEWHQQPIFRQVCTRWKNFIDSSDKILNNRYGATLIRLNRFDSEGELQFHSLVNYRSGFVRPSPGAAFTPCILYENKAGEIIGSSPEIDLSFFRSHALLRPGSGYRANGSLICLLDLNHTCTATDIAEFSIGDGDGTVGSFLQGASEALENISSFIQGKYIKTWFEVFKRTKPVRGFLFSIAMYVQPEREADANDPERTDFERNNASALEYKLL